MKKSIFKYEPDVYTPQKAKKELSYKEARAEYSRLRSIALKRLSRFEGTEYSGAEITRRYRPESFPRLSDIGGDSTAVALLLSDVYRFLLLKGSTVTGQREIRDKTIETLHRRGYMFVNAGNYQSFVSYLEKARAQSIARFFDSVRAAELFEEYDGMELSPDKAAEEFLEYEKSQARGGRRRNRRTR